MSKTKIGNEEVDTTGWSPDEVAIAELQAEIVATIERCAQVAKIRTFTMYRRNVSDATHNALQKNAPDQPQFEGVIWSDGTCTIRWLTAKRSTAVWSSFDDMMAIHGHPEYGSEIEWHDADYHRKLKDEQQ